MKCSNKIYFHLSVRIFLSYQLQLFQAVPLAELEMAYQKPIQHLLLRFMKKSTSLEHLFHMHHLLFILLAIIKVLLAISRWPMLLESFLQFSYFPIIIFLRVITIFLMQMLILPHFEHLYLRHQHPFHHSLLISLMPLYFPSFLQ